MFESLGLGGEAETAYLHLVRHGPTTLRQLARQLGRPEPNVRCAIDELHQLGLLYTTAKAGGPIVAVPLTMGVEHLITQRERELERLRHSTEQLVAHIDAPARRAGADQFQILTGRDDVVRQMYQLQASARDRMRLLIRGPDGATPLLHDTLDRHGPRGLNYQLIYDECSLASTGGVAGVSARLGELAQSRLAKQLPINLALVDRTAALVPLELDAAVAEQAVVIRNCALLQAMEALFDSVWQMATPLTVGRSAALPAGRRPAHGGPGAGSDAGTADELDRPDLALLSLLVGGFTDDAAGARLGMSRRTVARRVQRLMTATGARSRLQLGWWARERRWL